MRAWLEALGLEARLPDARFLEDLFHVFQRRVAFETLTRPAGDAARFDPEAFAAEWPDEERGLTGEERTGAFLWLAKEVGFTCELVQSLCSRPWVTAERDESRQSGGTGGFSSKVNGGEAHRAIVVTLDGRRILADAGFPFPVLVPLDAPAIEIPTGFGALTVERDAGEGRRINCDARGSVEELLRLAPVRLSNPLPLEEICRPSPGASPTLEAGEAGARGSTRSAPAPFALRVLDDRVLHWAGGVMTILDAWSVLTYPLAGTERAAVASLFALNLEGVDLPAAAAAEVPPLLTVFHTVPLPPEAVRRGLVLSELPPSSLVASREAVVEAVPGGARIALRAALGGSVPPAGPGESVRKTLVFHLAMDLLRLGTAPG